MRRVAIEHGLERADDVRAAPLRLGAAGFPVVPGLRVHRGFGVEREHRVVGGKGGRDGLHRIGIGRIERCAIGRRIGCIALFERADQRLLLRGGVALEGDCLAQCRHGGRVRLRHHRHVDVAAQHIGFAPEAHRALGVELLRGLEGTLRLGVVEAESQSQTLVEVRLRLGVAGRDAELERAQVLVERRLAAGRVRRRRSLARDADQRFQQFGRAGDDGAADAARGRQQWIEPVSGRDRR